MKWGEVGLDRPPELRIKGTSDEVGELISYMLLFLNVEIQSVKGVLSCYAIPQCYCWCLCVWWNQACSTCDIQPSVSCGIYFGLWTRDVCVVCGHLHQDILLVGVVSYAFCLAVAEWHCCRELGSKNLIWQGRFSLEGESCKGLCPLTNRIIGPPKGQSRI